MESLSGIHDAKQTLTKENTGCSKTKTRIILFIFLVGFLMGAMAPWLSAVTLRFFETTCGMLIAFLAVSWCVFDAKEREFRLGVPLKIVCFFILLVGLPIYLFRSRGVRGFLALLAAVAIILLFCLTCAIGEIVGLLIGDRLDYWDYSVF